MEHNGGTPVPHCIDLDHGGSHRHHDLGTHTQLLGTQCNPLRVITR